MTAKTIKRALRSKFSEYLDSITDKNLVPLIRRDALITGGSIASFLLGDEPNDYDVYFKTKETTAAVAAYYVKQWKDNPPTTFKTSNRRVDIHLDTSGDRVKIVVKSAGIASENGTDDYQYFESARPEATKEYVAKVAEAVTDDLAKPKYRPVFLTSNAITLSDKIQIVIRFYGTAATIHTNFDFVHCTCVWDAETGELTLPNEALQSLLAKQLTYTRSLYPLCSFIRTRKFLGKGWNINAGQYVKPAWDLNKLDLSDSAVLEDQMIGVDAAYFSQVLEALRERGGKVEEAYLMEIIDRIF